MLGSWPKGLGRYPVRKTAVAFLLTAAIQRKIHRCEERQQQLKEELEALQDLNHIMYFTHKDRDARSSSLSVSSVSSKDYPFQNQE